MSALVKNSGCLLMVETINNLDNRVVSGNLSVCICTRNRPEELEKCILSVVACGTSICEIIVSDDSTDNSVYEMITAKFVKVKYVKGPKKGLGANRNCVVNNATSDYVIFLDDDSEIDHGFIGAVDAFIEANNFDMKRIMITGNQIEFGKSIKPHDQNYLGFQNVEYKPGQEYKTVNIMATIFPRELLLKVKFDEQLVYGYDEVDICSRCRLYGATVAYCADADVFHYPSKINRDYYNNFTESSRIYVTFKRYNFVEGKAIKAWSFLFLSLVHLFLSRIKHGGLDGIRQFFVISGKALSYIQKNRRMMNHSN